MCIDRRIRYNFKKPPLTKCLPFPPTYSFCWLTTGAHTLWGDPSTKISAWGGQRWHRAMRNQHFSEAAFGSQSRYCSVPKLRPDHTVQRDTACLLCSREGRNTLLKKMLLITQQQISMSILMLKCALRVLERDHRDLLSLWDPGWP